MLFRAAAQSLRQVGPRRAAVPFSQFRLYAKHNKPRKPLEYQTPSPLSRHGPSAQRSPTNPTVIERVGAASASGRNDRSDPPDFSRTQNEFDTTSASRMTNEPGSVGSGPNRPSAEPSRFSGQPEYSKLQDEFGTTSSSDQNTAPQSTSAYTVDPAEAHNQQQQSSQPLPDLTRGIPSTLDSEMAQAENASQASPSSLNVTEDPSQPSPAGGRRGGGDLPKSANITSMERRRNQFANYMYAFLFSSTLLGTVYLGRNWENEEEERKHSDAPSGWGLGLFYGRVSARLAGMLDYYNEPAFPKLLPDTDPAWERPYTLVLSLEDLLVHSEWTREHGWRMAKRPGVDYFLRYLGQYYELVVFTSVPSMAGDSIIRKLDPYRIIMWPLYREATRYKNGEYIKDLSYLNRPLSKVILLDTLPAHAKLQPENAIIIPKWEGATTDTELVSLIPFLEYAANMGFDDIRPVLKSFEGTHIPTEYARREGLAREKFREAYAAETKGRRKKSGGGFLSGALGMKSTGLQGVGMPYGEESLSEGFEKGKTYMDQVRERGQRQYEFVEKEIREKGEEWLKETAEAEKKMQEEAMKGMKNNVLGGLFAGAGEKK